MVREHVRLWTSKKAAEIPSTLWPDDFFFKELPSLSQVLDVGCGGGRLALHLAQLGHHVITVDLSLDAVDQGRRAALRQRVSERCQFYQGTATALGMLARTFDAVVIQAVLTTVSDPSDRRNILAEVMSVLKPSGFLYLAEFAQTWHRRDYRDRYLQNEPTTGECGLFIVHGDDGSETYRAKHFSHREIVELILESGFYLSAFKHANFSTRSGNIIDGFQIIARPDPTHEGEPQL